jgi:hypothetical protein
MPTVHPYTRDEVIAGGFEARCTTRDGCRYLWHCGQGVRYDPGTGITTLVTNASALPEGPWLATELGEAELANRASD